MATPASEDFSVSRWQLLYQRRGDFLDRAVEKDDVVRRAAFPAVGEGAAHGFNARFAGRRRQGLVRFQRNGFQSDGLQQSGGIAGARSDDECPLAGARRELAQQAPERRGGHHRPVFRQGQRPVEIGQGLCGFRNEPLALDRGHRGQHAAVGHRFGAELAVDHCPPGQAVILHQVLVRRELFYATNTVAVQALLIL